MRRAAIILSAVLALAACGGSKAEFNEKALRDYTRDHSTKPSQKDVDEWVTAARGVCANVDALRYAIFLDHEGHGPTVAAYKVACPKTFAATGVSLP